ncbi:hypothetical protein [uncultured Microbulbifer sp.]|uniref:hypothetical protein n=1 Tax=uncultured Microbulbifer sp. TaxID=348147 RepID=UPI0025EDCFBE|nr:hypothetical protein [uncultured Microbulbifer sp.]
MSGQQKFQIVSAGKTLRAKEPGEVLAQVTSTFSISAQQARRLLLKGWVIKDQLSPGQVVQYRTQLQQIGLKIEVHPAGKFDNRALLARMQFAQQRRERKEAPAKVVASSPAVVEESARREQQDKPAAPEKQAPANPTQVDHKKPAAEAASTARAREQLAALFEDDRSGAGGPSAAERARLLAALPAACLVPLVFLSLAVFCVYQACLALWRIPEAVMAGSLGAGTLIGSGLTLLLLGLFAALFLIPYYRARRDSGSPGISLGKADAPGLFLLLEILKGKLDGVVPTAVQANPGADTLARSEGFVAHWRGEVTLSLGLSAAATLNGGDNLALIARALSFHQTRLIRVASWLQLVPQQRLQAMQEALESESTVVSAGGEAKGPARALHKLLAMSGLALVPVIERLHGLHRGLSKGLGTLLERRADGIAASVLGSDACAGFAARWHQLVHADLVTSEINREAQLMGKRLSDYPAAVGWLYRNLDSETRSSIELAMDEDSDVWNPAEPANHSRVAEMEERQLPSMLARSDFSLAKLFAEFRELSSRVSRLGVDEHCRAVDNHLLMTANKEVEQAQGVLAEYFNRVMPRELLALKVPAHEELQQMDLQQTVDWLRSRLVDLREQEQRHATLQLAASRIQLGAALLRSNCKVDPGKYHLSGVTPAAADESRRDNRERLKECQQQRHRIWQMFYQRILKALETLDVSEHSRSQELLSQLAAFDRLREPLASLEQYGDLVSEAIEQMAEEKIPEQLLQKYTALILKQIDQLLALVEDHGEAMGAALAQRVAVFSESRSFLDGQQARDERGRLQAVELRCKHVCALVVECYQQVLAELLELCLAEERRRNIRPLRLAGVLS